MHRRQAIQNVALLLGGTVIGGQLFLSGGCKPATTTVEALFTPAYKDLLSEIAETILPATATPGAKEAGVGDFIAIMVKDCYSPKDQQTFVNGLDTLEKVSKEKQGDTFLNLSAEKRTALLQLLDREQKAYYQTKKEEDPPHYFRMLKELTLLGFFTSETGATKALRYEAVPGRYEGCIDYKKGDRAWAS